MERQLSLEWLGGPTERRLRAARPNFDDLPWDSFSLDDDHDPVLLDEARAVWTNGVFTEYASAAAFSALSLALLEAEAPVDLCAAAADFAVDELVHVTLVSRLVMTLGGAAPFHADLGKLAPFTRSTSPRMRAAEIAVKVSCVGEALSLPALSSSHAGATHPLSKAVLSRLRHDEGPHAAIGHWFLDWASRWLTDGDRAFLGDVASDAVAVYAPIWQDHDDAYTRFMEAAVDERIIARLANAGIAVRRPTPAAAAASADLPSAATSCRPR